MDSKSRFNAEGKPDGGSIDQKGSRVRSQFTLFFVITRVRGWRETNRLANADGTLRFHFLSGMPRLSPGNRSTNFHIVSYSELFRHCEERRVTDPSIIDPSITDPSITDPRITDPSDEAIPIDEGKTIPRLLRSGLRLSLAMTHRSVREFGNPFLGRNKRLTELKEPAVL